MKLLFEDGRLGSIFVFGFAVGLLLAFCSASVQAQNSPPSGAGSPTAGNVENGKKLFNTVGCWMCHGYSAQGGTGTPLAPDPIPLPAFIQYVRTPRGQMPPYTAKVLKDSELADIHAFLKTIPKPPDPASIPLLNGVN